MMESKKLLIVGIDPGITTAYAVLDIEGKLLKLNSSKQLELNMIISDVIEYGKAVLVGTDKAKAPGLAEAFATKLGARVVSPSEDLKVEEKRKITGSYNFEDEHQGDALASALFAHRQTKPLLDKIDYFTEQNGKQGIRDKIKELVITKRMSIKSAASLIEKKDEDAQIIEKVIFEKKLSERDFLKMYEKMKKYEDEIRLIKKFNSSLQKNIDSLEKTSKKQFMQKTNKPNDFRDKRINYLERAIKSKDIEFEKLKSAIRNLNRIVSNISDFYVLKKLDNLGINEFNFKNKLLNIKRNDILLVDNPNIASEALVETLKGKVFLIVHKKPISRKIENELPFIFINTKNLRIDEEKHFAFVEKKHFEAEKSRTDWVGKIVEDYRREKRLISG